MAGDQAKLLPDLLRDHDLKLARNGNGSHEISIDNVSIIHLSLEGFNVLVGGDDDPSIGQIRHIGTDGIIFPFLDQTQQLDLRLRTEVPDLIQEQGSARSLVD